MNTPASRTKHLASRVADVLNPFVVFTALYALAAFSEANLVRALVYVGAELAAAGFVVLPVVLLRRRRRVGDFWISARSERLVPALFLLSAFAVLLSALTLLDAPTDLFALTLSMGLASATVAALTLTWKASAHSAVAGHAAAASFLLFGLPWGLLFALALPAIVWARTVSGAHTLAQALVGAGIGAVFAVLFLT